MLKFEDNFAQKIYLYYLKIFDKMPLKKQLHFAERLYLISHDPDLLAFLKKHRRNVHDVIFKKHQPPKSHTKLIEKYHLTNYRFSLTNLALYKNIFKRSLQTAFLKRHSLKQLKKIDKTVLSTPANLIKMSTPFINFHYGLWLYLLHSPAQVKNDFLLKEVTRESRHTAANFNSLSYLLSHCIINGTHFYGRKIPQKQISPYLEMVKLIEKFISEKSREIMLDEKIEFLLCCRLLNYKSRLEKPIMALARRCLSSKGNFIMNLQKQGKKTAINYEHTNTLFLMIKQMDQSGWPPSSTAHTTTHGK